MDYSDTKVRRVIVRQLDGEISFQTELHENGKTTMGMVLIGRRITAKEAKYINRQVVGARYGDVQRILSEILKFDEDDLGRHDEEW